jgi:hypothetical protein
MMKTRDSIDPQLHRAAEDIAAFIHARIIEPSPAPLRLPDPAPDPVFAELVRRNRLGATLYAAAAESDTWPVSEDREQAWKREAYRRAASHPQQLNQAVHLAAELEARGVPCICMRGPFVGSRLYGTAAWRPFADVDLLVPRKRAWDAWSVAAAAGFELFQEHMPPGYFLRHHMHWQLKHPVSGLLCDLHWAVEHPYRLCRIDYAGIFDRARMVEVDGQRWREPDPVDHFLLLALHVKKHMPALYRLCRSEDASVQVFLHGEALHIVDLALLMRRDAATLDASRLLETAEAWQCLDALAGSLEYVQRIFNLRLEEDILEAAHARVPAWQREASALSPGLKAPRWWAVVAFKGGFRTEKMADAWAYLNPPPAYFGNAGGPGRLFRRTGYRIGAASRLAFAGVDTLLSVGLALLRGKRKGSPTRNRVPMEIG